VTLFSGGVVANQLVREGQVLVGSLFNEPMRVETVRPVNGDTWSVGLVGVQSERFRSVTLTASRIALINTDLSSGPRFCRPPSIAGWKI
jgi:hypothetical protein